MIYEKGQYVRVEGTNELKIIKEVVIVSEKTLYVCCDDVWYDGNNLYPHDMKIEIKNSLNEELSFSDFGEPKKVLNDLVDYVSKMDEKDFNSFLQTIKSSDIDLEGPLI